MSEPKFAKIALTFSIGQNSIELMKCIELESVEFDGEILRQQMIVLENYHNVHLKL